MQQLSKDEWKTLCRDAHLVCFNHFRDPEMDRIDFALVTAEDNVPCTFVTMRELDSESIYWQYGGAFPSIGKTVKVIKHYKRYFQWCKEMGYKRANTLIENDNIAMLKLALQCGFKIIGIRNFEGSVLCELMVNF